MTGFGTLKTSSMEGYQPPSMSATLAQHLPLQKFLIPGTLDMQARRSRNITEHVEGKAEALRVEQKLHRNLGHPTTYSLLLNCCKAATPVSL
jgi:hypothetical protein